MGLFKSRSQPLVRHVGVDLRGGQRSVPEHLLHAAKVRAALEQMGGHRVPKSVRAEVGCPIGYLKKTMDDPTHHPRVDPLATFTKEHGLARLSRRQLEPWPTQPGLNGTYGRRTERDRSLLAAFAEDSDHTALPIKISKVETAQLGYPDSGGVQDLHDGGVTSGHRCPSLSSRGNRPIKHLSGRCSLQCGRQYATDLGRAKVGRWICNYMPRLLCPGEEHARCGRSALQSGAGVTKGVLLGQPAAQRP